MQAPFSPVKQRFQSHSSLPSSDVFDSLPKRLSEIARVFEQYVVVKDRRYRCKVYKESFLGYDAVSLLHSILTNAYDTEYSRKHAEILGRELAKKFNLFEHVAKGHLLEDDYLMYRFIAPKHRPRPSTNSQEDDTKYLNDLFSANIVHMGNDEEEESAVFDEFAALGFMMETAADTTESVGRGSGSSTTTSERSSVARRIFSAPGVLCSSFTSGTPDGSTHDAASSRLSGGSTDSSGDFASTGSTGDSAAAPPPAPPAPPLMQSISLPPLSSPKPKPPSADNRQFRAGRKGRGGEPKSIVPMINLDDIDLREAAESFEKNVQVKTQRYRGRKYENVFIGVDAVDLLIASRWVTRRGEAVAICQAMMREYNLFQHVSDSHDFKDDFYFYRFNDKSVRTGGLELKEVKVPGEQGVQKQQQEQEQQTTLEQIAEDLQANVSIENRRYRLRVYNECFVGSQAVSFLVGANYAPSRSAGVELGRRLATELNLFEHVTKQHELEDDLLFYRFVEKEKREIPPKQKEETVDNYGSLSSRMELMRLADVFRTKVTVTTHRYRLQNYKNTFIGSEAVDLIVNSSMTKCRKDAVALGQRFCNELQLFHHIKREHDFKDDFLFYRYSDDTSVDEMGDSMSGSVALDPLSTEKLESVAQAMRRNLPLKNRRRLQKSYKDTFLGTEVVDYLIRTSAATTRREAVQLGRELARVCNLFDHVEGYHELQDMRLFYQFKTPLFKTNPSETVDLTELRDLASQFVTGVAVNNNRYNLRVYRNTFVGQDAVSFLVDAGLATSREDAVQLGRKFMNTFNLFEHVTRDHSFDDKFYFYRYTGGTERLLWNVPSSRASSALDDDDDEEEDDSVLGLRDEGSSEILRRRISEFEEKVTTRRQQGRGLMMSSARGSTLSVDGAMLETTTAERLRRWASDFRRRDPRYRILHFFTEVAHTGAHDVENAGIQLENIHPLLWFISRAAVFTVWRPCHFDAIRKMMLGQAVGKGFDIKGKSAKKGKLSGFVPFLQISENRHKKEVRTLPKQGRIRLFLSSQNFLSRIEVANRLVAVAEEMMSTVAEAKEILSDRNTDTASREQAEKILLWDVGDFSITFIDDYAPACYGLDIPLRVFWELFIARRDISRKPDSQYFDPERPSTPDYQDYNLHSLLSKPMHGNPRCVLYQNDRSDPMNPHELLMAYQDPQRVLPVVSDFDAFLVGTRRVPFDPAKGALSPDQLDVLKWSIRQIGKILDGPIRPENWNRRWLEVLNHEKRKGFHPSIPRFGFGDPRSYSIMENAVQRLSYDGAVRHGPECFNYTFPQEADEELLVISDILTPVPWKYMTPEELQDFLSARINDGYTFPLNPKWVLCDPGWKPLYDRLLASEREDVQNSMKIWFPPESGVREQIEDIHARIPNGFERGVRGSER